jgi:hypothetical protein
MIAFRICCFLVAVALAGPAPAQFDPFAVAAPRPLQGPYPIACSNVAQDFSRLPAGEPVEATWEGFPRTNGSSRYITDLLSEPNDTLIVRFTAPDDRVLFGPWSGQALSDVVLVCYPTTTANGRPDYPLPNGVRVPHMQRGSEPPILPGTTQRWPVLAFSHGYGGSPLSMGHFAALSLFASYGYVVVAPFHGDPRYALLSFDDPSSALQAIAQFERYTAMQALRPVSIARSLDLVLSHPHWSDRLDPNRIGGFGASQGGETMMLLGGAELTTSIFLTSERVVRDDRFKAAVGYVPYFGQRILPAFGDDNRGVGDVTLPYLAISGDADFTAPIGLVEEGLQRHAGSRKLVSLSGVQHGFDPSRAGDIFTWALEWLDAFVLDDRNARARVTRMLLVEGSGEDVVRIDRVLPASELANERIVVEYYHASLDHYFITSLPREIAILDEGVEIPGWQRTGFQFKSWAPGAGSGVPACRFFGTPGLGQNSHFFTVDATECEIVKTKPEWIYEGLVFQAEPFGPGGCPGDRIVVTRLYNNGMGGHANHRYLTSYSEAGDMVGRGWIVEGPVFCMPP